MTIAFESAVFIVCVVVLLYVAAECFVVVAFGVSSLASIRRFVCAKIRGTRFLPLKDELRTLVANGSIRVGSELIVGRRHDASDIQAVIYAVPPDLARKEPGTKLLVESIGKNFIELRAIECEADDD